MSGIPSGDARPPFVRGLFMHMTFDDQLQRAFDTLTDRLQDDIRREVQLAVGEIGAGHAAREAELTREIEAVRAAAISDLEMTCMNAEREAHEAREALARAVDAVVAASAEREAEAVAAAREQATREAEALYHTEQALSTSVAADRLLDGVRSIGRARSLGETLDTLVSCAAREAERAAVLTVRDGALRGRRFIGFSALDENPARDASFDDRGLSDRARQTHGVAADDHGCAIPLALGSDVVAVLFADNGNAAALEVLACHAARTLEVLVAFQAARANTSVPAGDDDEDEVAARRYARLLVSEIRLYHEPEVVAGRRERNLASRLGGEIAHARSLYEQRIPPAVRQHAAYFDEELVRTLADGDATLLELRM